MSMSRMPRCRGADDCLATRFFMAGRAQAGMQFAGWGFTEQGDYGFCRWLSHVQNAVWLPDRGCLLAWEVEIRAC